MSLESLRHFLLICTLINYLVLMIWFVAFWAGKGWMKRIHRHWFELGDGTFDAIHYSGMAAYKIGILLFNLVPLAALAWMGHSH